MRYSFGGLEVCQHPGKSYDQLFSRHIMAAANSVTVCGCNPWLQPD